MNDNACDMDVSRASGKQPVRMAHVGSQRKVHGRRNRNARMTTKATSVAPGSDIKTAARKRGA